MTAATSFQLCQLTLSANMEADKGALEDEVPGNLDLVPGSRRVSRSTIFQPESRGLYPQNHAGQHENELPDMTLLSHNQDLKKCAQKARTVIQKARYPPLCLGDCPLTCSFYPGSLLYRPRKASPSGWVVKGLGRSFGYAVYLHTGD